MPAIGDSGGGVARGTLERLLRPVWNALVAYGSMWLPAEQNHVLQEYYRSLPAPPPAALLTMPIPVDATDSGRTTLSAS
ncbi:hypothetical protein ABZ930_37760 [Streptomyces sp. NPDC046716]|uniref:hypothetical protein n=1 Tax=Streptomyces sp. NPDC046716 TaxID=3157093 RepID=UPI0033C122E9